MSLLVDACYGREISRTPVWLMRQAGRYLPEYMKIRRQHGFHAMMSEPDLITEISLQPIQRFNMDAAILYSDILVIPEAMGINFRLVPGTGPVFENPVKRKDKIMKLNPPNPRKLFHVLKGVHQLRKELSPEKALIGFAGAPWTIATYMVEGKPSKDYRYIRSLAHTEPKAFHFLMEVLTKGIIQFVTEQVKAGADVIQIFDTNAAYISRDFFETNCLPYLKRIVAAVKKTGAPLILFVKGGNWYDIFKELGVEVVGLDWNLSLGEVRKKLGEDISLQGNLDPAILLTSEEIIHRETIKVLESYGAGNRHIFNLGHGITPDVQPDAVETVVETVKSESPKFHASNTKDSVLVG